MNNNNIVPFNRPISRPVTCKISDDTFKGGMPIPKKHAAEAIKSISDINKITSYLKVNKRYRDNLIFVMGINFGIRAGDLLRIKVGDVVSNNSYKQEVIIAEQKTSKRDSEGNITKYKFHTCYMNDSVMDALDDYFNSLGREVNLNEYLFTSISNNGKNANEPLARYSVERILKHIVNDECGIDVRASTHMLRKTFCYHILINAPDQQNAVAFLQKVTGHASKDSVLAYIGVTADEIGAVCRNLNLGSGNTDDRQVLSYRNTIRIAK